MQGEGGGSSIVKAGDHQQYPQQLLNVQHSTWSSNANTLRLQSPCVAATCCHTGGSFHLIRGRACVLTTALTVLQPQCATAWRVFHPVVCWGAGSAAASRDAPCASHVHTCIPKSSMLFNRGAGRCRYTLQQPALPHFSNQPRCMVAQHLLQFAVQPTPDKYSSNTSSDMVFLFQHGACVCHASQQWYY